VRETLDRLAYLADLAVKRQSIWDVSVKESFMRIGFAALLAGLMVSPAHSEDLVFMLVNDSSYTILEMNVSPVGEELWGENILTVDSVPPGMSGDVTIADGLDVCDYDLRFITEDGLEATKEQNLCEINTFTVND
jgi:hypothetical protein